MSTESSKSDVLDIPVLKNLFSGNPIGYLDIGARFGYHSLVDAVHQYVSYLGFEPDIEECNRLNANADMKAFWNQFNVLPHALYDKHTTANLNILSLANNSSLLQPNPHIIDRYNMKEKWSIVKSVPVETVTLDHVLFDLALGEKSAGEIIKVDTQGTEFEILSGASRTLKERTVCVISEVEFCQIYENQKLFSDVELLLRKSGFSFYGFMTFHTRSKKTLNKKTNIGRERAFYADAVFFKDPFSDPTSIMSQRELNALFIAAIITQFYDFAKEILNTKMLRYDVDDIAVLNQLIDKLSYCDPQNTKKELDHVVNLLANNIENSNIVLGKFIDKIQFPDFADCI